MKRTLTIILALALILTGIAAFAEGTDTVLPDNQTSMEETFDENTQEPDTDAAQASDEDAAQAPADGRTDSGCPGRNGMGPMNGFRGGRGGMNGGRHSKGGMGRMNNTPDGGMNGKNGRSPMNGQTPSDGTAPNDGTMPQFPNNGTTPNDGTAPNDGSMPNNGTMPDNGNMPQFPESGAQPSDGGAPELPDGEKPFGKELDSYVEDGVITEETREAIEKYLEENRPEAAGGAAPETGAQPSESGFPEAPDGGVQNKLLDELLEAGIITQSEYDAIAALNAGEAAAE